MSAEKENIKVVILAGGFGTRVSEESHLKPKPMIKIGDKPMLWHIMKIYSHYGFNDFIICLGYKGYMIKEYFANYFLYQHDITIDVSSKNIEVHSKTSENWKVSLIDTGLNSLTGTRIKRIQKHIGNNTFMLTYGDGVADIDINALLKFHRSHGKLATVTSIQPEGKFGALDIDGNGIVRSFVEKPRGDSSWINGGFFVLEPDIFDYIKAEENVAWEKEPLESLAKAGQLVTYRHTGFWGCMDTLRDSKHLNILWETGKAPWAVWKNRHD